MILAMLFLIGLGVASLGVAAYTFVAERRRQAVLDRALGTHNDSGRRDAFSDAITPKRQFNLLKQLPAGFENSKHATKLIYAGFDTLNAPSLFVAARVATLVVIPTVVALLMVRSPAELLMLIVPGSALIAWILPIAVLARLVRVRQERVRRGLPDALDLLVVCVEAGISLDAAILRVARELSFSYPDLSRELLIVNRKTNAGVTREEAIRGLWTRTGVDDLRALSSSLIQTEKWGTSITKVLRVSAATLRRKRRQHAEKRVAVAPVKMTFPLVTMILPALFIIILGPAVLQVIVSLSGTGR